MRGTINARCVKQVYYPTYHSSLLESHFSLVCDWLLMTVTLQMSTGYLCFVIISGLLCRWKVYYNFQHEPIKNCIEFTSARHRPCEWEFRPAIFDHAVIYAAFPHET